MARTIMLRYFVASIALIAGCAASAAIAEAGPRGADCVNCTRPKSYDSESPARIRHERDRRGPDAGTPSDDAPASESAPQAAPGSNGGAKPRRSAETPATECKNCPPPKHYDSVEVIKHVRDVDQSRVINTKSEVVIPPRVREINKLIIHENVTRNVGVIRHNHQIIEREIRYVHRRRPPVYAPQTYVVPTYRVQPVLVPVPQNSGCGCDGPSYRYGVGYIYTPEYVRVARPSVPSYPAPVVMSDGYAYR